MIKRVQKPLYILIELLILVGFGVFIYFNLDKTVEFFCPLMQKVYTTKLIYLTILHAVMAFIAGYVFCAILKTKVTELCEAYQKRHENTSIEKDGDKAKIDVLEAKIKTLEAALEAALRNK